MTIRIIDCEAFPFVPDGWKIESHSKGGQFEFDLEMIGLCVTDYQSQYTTDCRKELEGKLLLNACVLDYLLINQDLIPEEWKQGKKHFWGTIFRNKNGWLTVRCLCWNEDKWVSHAISWATGKFVARPRAYS